MGLSGPRKRAKFSYDPNNTNWSRSESKYGQRILQAQGWKPGDYLGAKNAPHAKYHTVANSSRIKVVLREENLGIGARVGAAGVEWETTGMDGFQDLLGRLNGKSQEELEKAMKSKEALKRNLYVDRRWGMLRFVSGGLLVGDKVEEAREVDKMNKPSHETPAKATEDFKQSEPGQKTQNISGSRSYSREGSKVSKKRDGSSVAAECDGMQSEKKTQAESIAPISSTDEKALRKAEKAQRKICRKLRREARNQDKPQTLDHQHAPVLDDQISAMASEPAKNDANSEKYRSGIQTVRQRQIRQKKMAMIDSKALKEILMKKAG